MDQAWDDFKSSLSDAPITNDFTTRFQYPLRADATEAVDAGLAMLKRCAPFVVVFNQEFSRIDIKSHDETVNFTVVRRTPLEQEGLQHITVEESKNGSRTEKKYLLTQGEKASVAVLLGAIGDDLACLPVGNIPRLFLGFPLIGTENFSFPAVINSLSFTPTENRDGVYLGQSSNDAANINNQTVIEEACELLVGLLRFAASSGWRDVHLLADVLPVQERDWLNPKWLRKCIKDLFIKEIRQTRVVLNGFGQVIEPGHLELPLAETAEGVETLWDLLGELQGGREGLPMQDEAVGWCNAVKSWGRVSECEISSFDEVTDGRKLALYVHETSYDPSANPTTHRLSRLDLEEDITAINWLDKLISFLRDNGMSELLREYRIVPSQEGFLRTLPRLYRDREIHEELKEIAGMLGWRIRPNLRDVQLTSLAEEAGAGDWDSKYVCCNTSDSFDKEVAARALQF